jgi:hypothetical protein
MMELRDLKQSESESPLKTEISLRGILVTVPIIGGGVRLCYIWRDWGLSLIG